MRKLFIVITFLLVSALYPTSRIIFADDVASLIKAIKDQKKQIEELKAKMEVMELIVAKDEGVSPNDSSNTTSALGFKEDKKPSPDEDLQKDNKLLHDKMAERCVPRNVKLQCETPGTKQIGNFNISGIALIDYKIGIGVKNPLAKLHVGGTPGVDGIKFPDGSLQTTANIVGQKGDKGDKGDQGIQGIQGDKGEQGTQGVQGVQGEQGIPGEKGEKGDQGMQGIQGVKGDKGDPGVVASLDNIPSRIAGDPGIVSGDWAPIPYTDASNTTDGDYSTFAYGSATGDGSDSTKRAYVTWDMGTVFDISIVTVKAEIFGSVKGNLRMQGSQDNVNWWNLEYPILVANNTLPKTEQTFFEKSRIRYIRFWYQTSESDPSNIRIYEIKVR